MSKYRDMQMTDLVEQIIRLGIERDAALQRSVIRRAARMSETGCARRW